MVAAAHAPASARLTESLAAAAAQFATAAAVLLPAAGAGGGRKRKGKGKKGGKVSDAKDKGNKASASGKPAETATDPLAAALERFLDALARCGARGGGGGPGEALAALYAAVYSLPPQRAAALGAALAAIARHKKLAKGIEERGCGRRGQSTRGRCDLCGRRRWFGVYSPMPVKPI